MFSRDPPCPPFLCGGEAFRLTIPPMKALLRFVRAEGINRAKGTGLRAFALSAQLLALLVLFAASSFPEVTIVDVISRTDIANGYEQITAKVHFAVDPKDPRSAVIADIDKAPKGADGRVEFTADMLALRPKTGGNGVALVDVVNRGGTTFLRLNRTAGQNLVGDGFLMKQGFTIIAIGWEFDVAVRNNSLRIDVPVATDNGASMRRLL